MFNIHTDTTCSSHAVFFTSILLYLKFWLSPSCVAEKKIFITKELGPYSLNRVEKTHNKRGMIRDHIRLRDNEDLQLP